MKTGEKTPAFIRLSSLEGPARQGKPFTLTSPTQSSSPSARILPLGTKQGNLDETARERPVHIDEHCFVTIRSESQMTQERVG